VNVAFEELHRRLLRPTSLWVTAGALCERWRE
jgi:hypothetical protein